MKRLERLGPKSAQRKKGIREVLTQSGRGRSHRGGNQVGTSKRTVEG